MNDEDEWETFGEYRMRKTRVFTDESDFRTAAPSEQLVEITWSKRFRLRFAGFVRMLAIGFPIWLAGQAFDPKLGRVALVFGALVGLAVEAILFDIERRRHPLASLRIRSDSIELDDGKVKERMPRSTKLEVRVWEGQHQAVAHLPGRVVVLRESHDPEQLALLVETVDALD